MAWGFNFPAITIIYHQISAPALALVRYLIMLGVLVPLALLTGHKLTYDRGDALRVNALGLLSMGVYMVFFLEGMKHSNPAEAAIVLSTSPVWVNLIRVILKKQRFSWTSLLGAVIAIIGVALVVLKNRGNNSSELLGNILILTSAWIWAYCVVLSQPVIEKYGAIRALAIAMPAGLLVLVPYGLLPMLATPFRSFTTQSWLMLAHISLLAGVIGFLGFYAGVRKIGPSTAMLYQFFVPPTAAFFAWLVLDRPLYLLQALGLAIVISGVWISATANRLSRTKP